MEFSLALPNVSPGLAMIDEKREKEWFLNFIQLILFSKILLLIFRLYIKIRDKNQDKINKRKEDKK
jgi:hypothetical protein